MKKMLHRHLIHTYYTKYKELQKKLETKEIINNTVLYTKYSKEIAKIKKIALEYEEFLFLEKEIENLFLEKEKENSNEFHEIINQEIIEKKQKLNKLKIILESSLVPINEEDEKFCYIEIQGKAGGNEANIFTGDLLEMYIRYLNTKGWKVRIINASKSENGGFTEVLFIVETKGAYGLFCNEAGVHRVQRVPKTEAKGRIHTSTSKVIVLPVMKKTSTQIKREDLEIQTFRASGAGGQHVNKTDSAVRIIHKPTGIIAVSQAGRSQHDNKENALKVIKERLDHIKLLKEKETKKIIYRQAGRGERAEKIRTYNYPQNRVTDHRINKSWLKLDRIMQGDLEDIINSLIHWKKENTLKELLSKNDLSKKN